MSVTRGIRSWVAATAGDAARGTEARLSRQLRFGGRYDLDDRRRASERLIVVLAGFKDFLWPYTLERIARFAPPDVDVCLVSAGVRSERLAEMAAKHGWTYLATRNGRISTALNIAIDLHERAGVIYKVDEDMILPEGFFESLLEGFERAEREQRYVPGFASPLVNLNGYSYVPFLEARGLSDEWQERFGPLTQRCLHIPVHDDPEAAHWLWRHTLPFDEVAAEFARRRFTYSACPHRFSIGAIVFRRDLWEAMAGFRAVVAPPGLGVDEDWICVQCVSLSRAMVVIHNLLAGHFAFGAQEAVMRTHLEELAPGLAVSAAPRPAGRRTP